MKRFFYLLFIISGAVNSYSQCRVITTIAGNGGYFFANEGGQASAAGLTGNNGLLIDSNGNIYFVDGISRNSLRKINTSGVVTTIATGFLFVEGIAADKKGNIYVADQGNRRICKIEPDGKNSVFAGNGKVYTGGNVDGMKATGRAITTPSGVAVDKIGNVYIAAYIGCYWVDTSGILHQLSGSGGLQYQNGVFKEQFYCDGVAVDSQSNVYILDRKNRQIRKLNKAGISTVIAGTGTSGFSGDGGAATAAQLLDPISITLDRSGNIYIVDGMQASRIRMINTQGVISTIAGTGSYSSPAINHLNKDNANGQAAASFELGNAYCVAVDDSDNVYAVANDRIYKISMAPALTTGTITGPSSVCVNSSVTLTNTQSGGSWLSLNSAIATVSNTGIVTGVSAGTDTIYNTVSNGCGSRTAKKAILVNPLPSSVSITGLSTLCTGSTIVLGSSDKTNSGTWFSSNTSVATVSSTGVVGGVAVGTTNISYVVTNGCGSYTATKTVTVNTVPSPGAITGASTVCIGGSSTTLNNTVGGGTWSSKGNLVSISGASDGTWAMLTGVTAGSDTIKYTVTNGCGSKITTIPIIVIAPPLAGTITGTSTVVVNKTVSLTSNKSGGTWSSLNNAIATVNNSGIVTGVTTGVATIIYSVSNVCSEDVANTKITVVPQLRLDSISGYSSVNKGKTIELTCATTGGVWSSSDTLIARVNNAGVVTGVAGGKVAITYKVGDVNNGVSVTKKITVFANPKKSVFHVGSPSFKSTCRDQVADISANLVVRDPDTGKTLIWRLVRAPKHGSTLAEGIAVSTGDTVSLNNRTYTPNSGYVGKDTMFVSISDGTNSAQINIFITVKDAPAIPVINGPDQVFLNDSVTFSAIPLGGNFKSNNANIICRPGGGVVVGKAIGNSIVTYSVTNNGCTTTSMKSISIQKR